MTRLTHYWGPHFNRDEDVPGTTPIFLCDSYWVSALSIFFCPYLFDAMVEEGLKQLRLHTVKDTGCCEPRQPAAIARSAQPPQRTMGSWSKVLTASTAGRLKGSLQHQVQADREPTTERSHTWEHAVNSEAQPRGCGWYPDDDKGSGWKARQLGHHQGLDYRRIKESDSPEIPNTWLNIFMNILEAENN